MLMEEDKMLGIYVDSLFSSEKCQEFYDLPTFTYKHGGFVERWKEKYKGDMVMIG